ncbi:17049_t:CDS:1, partial [Dentiscutata heterogama]
MTICLLGFTSKMPFSNLAVISAVLTLRGSVIARTKLLCQRPLNV